MLRCSLVNEDESCKEAVGGTKLVDLIAGRMMKDTGQSINGCRSYKISVPGVHVGDNFY